MKARSTMTNWRFSPADSRRSPPAARAPRRVDVPVVEVGGAALRVEGRAEVFHGGVAGLAGLAPRALEDAEGVRPSVEAELAGDNRQAMLALHIGRCGKEGLVGGATVLGERAEALQGGGVSVVDAAVEDLRAHLQLSNRVDHDVLLVFGRDPLPPARGEFMRPRREHRGVDVVRGRVKASFRRGGRPCAPVPRKLRRVPGRGKGSLPRVGGGLPSDERRQRSDRAGPRSKPEVLG